MGAVSIVREATEDWEQELRELHEEGTNGAYKLRSIFQEGWHLHEGKTSI